VHALRGFSKLRESKDSKLQQGPTHGPLDGKTLQNKTRILYQIDERVSQALRHTASASLAGVWAIVAKLSDADVLMLLLHFASQLSESTTAHTCH
jgi:hypothetical protein